MKEGVWKKEVRENASVKDLGPYHKIERGVYAEKEKGILIVKRRKGGSTGIYRESAKERIHLTF